MRMPVDSNYAQNHIAHSIILRIFAIVSKKTHNFAPHI
jgi:hypothetical protein